MSADLEHHSDVAYEKTDVSQKEIVRITVISVVLLIVSFVLLNDVFVMWREHDMKQYVYSVESKALRAVRMEEAEKLEKYALIDSSTNKYQIPIERAMYLIAEEAYQKK